ncbi:MAG: AraC family transcriptional regulator [Fimbriimonadaceae bacterium]|nr:AraC family transcriptional regulator [Fimbriimonadaceae bacterium]
MPKSMAQHPDIFLLDRLMASLRIESDVIGRVSASEPCGIEFASVPDRAGFIFALEGPLWLQSSESMMHLEPGDFALCLAPKSVFVRTAPGIPVSAIDTLLCESRQVCQSGLVYRVGHATPTHLYVAGLVRVQNLLAHPLLRSLPDVVTVRRNAGAQPIHALLTQIVDEVDAIQPGSRPIINRLLDAVIMHAIRSYALADGGWAGFLSDPEIGRVVARIHADPAADWSLARMAKIAGLSRSTFADRFRRTVGQAPMSYVTRWRMLLALERLRTTSGSIGSVALDVGYTSESAFSRAFLREVGYRPGERRTERQPEIGPTDESAGNHR